MSRLSLAIKLLEHNARPDQLAGMARFGINPQRRFGLSMPVMRAIAKTLGHDHELALALWRTHIPDAQIVAGMVAESAKLTSEQMNEWAASFQSWDVCDQVCNCAFRKSSLAWSKVFEWAPRSEEFVRRAAFSLLSTLAVHDKDAADARFSAALSLIEQASGDDRNFVKKAVNWAVRNIGKRNFALNEAAVNAAYRIRQQGTRSARWIAADALRELTGEAVQRRVRS
jgi:3-methyladenine DNA glycosylase AlkD